MTNIFKDSRRDLRERAFQTLFALEFGGEMCIRDSIMRHRKISRLLDKSYKDLFFRSYLW